MGLSENALESLDARLGVGMNTIRPAFIWPEWKQDEPGSFTTEFAAEISEISEQLAPATSRSFIRRHAANPR